MAASKGTAALLFKHKAMKGTTREVKVLGRKPLTFSSHLAWVLLPTPLCSVVEKEDYCICAVLLLGTSSCKSLQLL